MAHYVLGIPVERTVSGCFLHYVSGSRMNDRKRSTELVGDIGEEVALHRFHLLEHLLVAVSERNHVYEYHNGGNGQQQGYQGQCEQGVPAAFLRLPAAVQHLDFVLFPLPLIAHPDILYMVQILLAGHVVGILTALHIALQRKGVIAPLLLDEIVQAVNLGQVFHRGYSFGLFHHLVQIEGRPVQITCVYIGPDQRDCGFKPVPHVGTALHNLICFLVLDYGCIIVSFLLGQTAEMCITEGNAHIRLGHPVEFQGLFIIETCRICHIPGLQDRTQICIIDGLSQSAAQGALPFQGLAEGLFRLHIVAHGQLNVAYAVETYHPVLESFPVLGIAGSRILVT